jgi:hypothetical protein
VNYAVSAGVLTSDSGVHKLEVLDSAYFPLDLIRRSTCLSVLFVRTVV